MENELSFFSLDRMKGDQAYLPAHPVASLLLVESFHWLAAQVANHQQDGNIYGECVLSEGWTSNPRGLGEKN